MFVVITLMRGRTISSDIPVASASKNCPEFPPNTGTNDMTKMMMPMPPIHCVKLRQKWRDRGKASMLSNVELPVVVKPQMDSKKALVNEGMAPLSRKGSVP